MARKVIPEFAIQLQPQSDEARAAIGFSHAGPGIGSRSKIGGVPDWLQGPATPTCSCGEEMSFYAQLDSIGDAVSFADCGMVYVFVCFGCFESTSIIQSY